MIQPMREFGPIDRLLDGVECALEAVAGNPAAGRPSPATDLDPVELSAEQQREVSGLMRINHTGEVCAQALYQGQALPARDAETRQYLTDSANEETDHLVWCKERLDELDARPSIFNPLWYAGSYAMGVAAATVSDRISLGFVVETERQVEAHLADHVDRLPAEDTRSRAILTQMQDDEARHADNAQARGGKTLPRPVPTLMRFASRGMKAVAYRI